VLTPGASGADRIPHAALDCSQKHRVPPHEQILVEISVHPSSESKERAIERMMTEYGHISDGHDSVDKDAMDEATVVKTPHKSPPNGKAGILPNPSKLLQ
jgi:hypothetical protein